MRRLHGFSRVPGPLVPYSDEVRRRRHVPGIYLLGWVKVKESGQRLVMNDMEFLASLFF